MSHVSPCSSSLREGLELFDLEIVEAPEVRDCPACGAPTHRADYPRRLSGASGDGKVVMVMRRSRCCSQQGCRKRRQVPSALFLGRCLFPLLQILIVMARRTTGPPHQSTVSHLARALGAHRDTIRRWATKLHERLRTSPWWRCRMCRLPLGETSLALRCIAAFGGFDGVNNETTVMAGIRQLVWPDAQTAIT